MCLNIIKCSDHYKFRAHFQATAPAGRYTPAATAVQRLCSGDPPPPPPPPSRLLGIAPLISDHAGGAGVGVYIHTPNRQAGHRQTGGRAGRQTDGRADGRGFTNKQTDQSRSNGRNSYIPCMYNIAESYIHTRDIQTPTGRHTIVYILYHADRPTLKTLQNIVQVYIQQL